LELRRLNQDKRENSSFLDPEIRLSLLGKLLQRISLMTIKNGERPEEYTALTLTSFKISASLKTADTAYPPLGIKLSDYGT
jgi:hypothetical protein